MTGAVLAMVSFGDVKQNSIGSICVAPPKEPKARTATVDVLAMVSFVYMKQNRFGSTCVPSPKESKTRTAILSMVSSGNVTQAG